MLIIGGTILRKKMIKLSKRHIKQAQDPTKLTADSLFKIIKFIFYRVPEKQRSRFMGKLRGKIIRIHPGVLGLKKIPPSASIGQAISITKNLLSGLNPAFTSQVIVELSKLLTTTQQQIVSIPEEMKKPK